MSCTHTTELGRAHIRLLSKCHEKRNLAEYEGHYEVDEQLLSELISNTKELRKHVESIVQVTSLAVYHQLSKKLGLREYMRETIDVVTRE